MMSQWNAVSTLDRMFDDVMGSALGTATTARTFAPTFDIRANEDEVTFVADVPGVKESDLEITLQEHILTVRGTRALDAKKDEHLMLGRPYGSFERNFNLGDSLDEEKLSASLDSGVLTIRIPKHPRARPRRIPIQTASRQLAEGT